MAKVPALIMDIVELIKALSMNLLIFIPLFFFSVCCFSAKSDISLSINDELKIMTYNIRLNTPSDGPNQWKNRRQALVDFIENEQPDIFGIQEGLLDQVNFLDSALIDYKSIGVGRDDGQIAGEFMSIYFRTDELSLLSWNTFWLSPTPEMVSMGWDAACFRTCTKATFIKGKDTLVVYNTHLDHQGQKARKESVKLLLSELQKEKFPVLLIGDFNLTPDSPLYGDLVNNLEDVATSETGTFNGFKIGEANTRRIDYIFTHKELKDKLTSYQVKMPKINGRQVSDHFPVIATFSL